MKIISLQAENVKRLKAVEIIPDGNTVIISGANGQGKTSVLDSIWYALGGGAATKTTPKPVRDGEDHASVTLDLGDLVVTRTWNEEGKSTLKVDSADGARYGTPQAILDGLVGRLSFDPLAFSEQDNKTQLATLLEMVDLPFDLGELADRRKGVYDERTAVNRDLKNLEGALSALPKPGPDTPTEEISTLDVLAEMRAAQQVKTDNESVRGGAVAAAARVEATTGAVLAAVEALGKLEAQLANEETIAETLAAAVEGLGDEPDMALFDVRLESVEEINAAVRALKERESVQVSINDAKTASKDLSDQLDALDRSKSDAMAAADMPIEGLAFDEDGVTFGGVPFAQCSAAERLRVSLAMAMALNPEIRVIRITDGSLLDSTNLALIQEMADAEDFQVWIEIVDETGSVGIFIEDGEIATPSTKTPAKTKAPTKKAVQK